MEHVQPGSMAEGSQHPQANRGIGVNVEMLLPVDHHVENSGRHSVSSSEGPSGISSGFIWVGITQ